MRPAVEERRLLEDSWWTLAMTQIIRLLHLRFIHCQNGTRRCDGTVHPCKHTNLSFLMSELQEKDYWSMKLRHFLIKVSMVHMSLMRVVISGTKGLPVSVLALKIQMIHHGFLEWRNCKIKVCVHLQVIVERGAKVCTIFLTPPLNNPLIRCERHG